MTRQPLMLSDTAMVLLRQYFELQEYFSAFNSQMAELEPKERSRLLQEWHQTHNTGQLLWQTYNDLLDDLRALWVFPDLSPQRCLDWHVVFDEKLMALTERVVLAPFGDEDDHNDFNYALNEKYKQFLAVHTQTKTTP